MRRLGSGEPDPLLFAFKFFLSPLFIDPEHFSLCQRVRAELDRLGLTNVTLDHWLASVTMKRTRRTKA